MDSNLTIEFLPVGNLVVERLTASGNGDLAALVHFERRASPLSAPVLLSENTSSVPTHYSIQSGAPLVSLDGESGPSMPSINDT